MPNRPTAKTKAFEACNVGSNPASAAYRREKGDNMLISLLIAILAFVIIFWLIERFVIPAVPAPWGKVIEVIVAIIAILWLLSRFLGINL